MNAPAQTCNRLQNPPFDFADLLTSGLMGDDLAGALNEHFAKITRVDIYLGIRVAVSVWTAEILEVRTERDAARLDLDSAQIELGWLRAQIAEMRTNGSWLRSPKSLEIAA
jgi:hypothetical protein